jgi:hypothetical protein
MMKFDRDTQLLIEAILDKHVHICNCDDCDEYGALEPMIVGHEWETSEGPAVKVAQDLRRDFNLDYNTVWMVFEIQDRFFKLTGWKSSYGVSHWNDYMEEVERKEETRVFYE